MVIRVWCWEPIVLTFILPGAVIIKMYLVSINPYINAFYEIKRCHVENWRKITQKIINLSVDLFLFSRFPQVDTVRAFHFGCNFLVEVDIVLPSNMPLREAHDIGESLQHRLESLADVERAFVHLDYESTHHPHSEHKVVWRHSQRHPLVTMPYISLICCISFSSPQITYCLVNKFIGFVIYYWFR